MTTISEGWKPQPLSMHHQNRDPFEWLPVHIQIPTQG